LTEVLTPSDTARRTATIDVAAVLADVRGFKTFVSVQTLHTLVDSLRADPGFQINEVGTSEGGKPIYHVRFGSGSVKVLLVGWIDANEPISGLTAFSLLTLLAARNPGLIAADVEWNLIPCIDPDGAALNEGWSQHPFSLERYMRDFHRPAGRDQVDCSFPIKHKRLSFASPVKETRILMSVLAEVRPAFYYPLHNNSGAMGAWFEWSKCRLAIDHPSGAITPARGGRATMAHWNQSRFRRTVR